MAPPRYCVICRSRWTTSARSQWRSATGHGPRAWSGRALRSDASSSSSSAGSPQALRDLAISLNNLGLVAEAQGDRPQAETVYRESLALRRQLAERLNGTPEALRDLSVSLDNLGRVAQARGDWQQADRVYRESLALRRQLVERLGGTPQSLEDLALSLLNVARVSPSDTGLHAEAARIYETLATRFPDDARYAERLAALRGDNAPSATSAPAAPS